MPEPNEKEKAKAHEIICKTHGVLVLNNEIDAVASAFAELRAEKEEAVKTAEQRVYAKCKTIIRTIMTMRSPNPEHESYLEKKLLDAIQEAANKAKGEGKG